MTSYFCIWIMKTFEPFHDKAIKLIMAVVAAWKQKHLLEKHVLNKEEKVLLLRVKPGGAHSTSSAWKLISWHPKGWTPGCLIPPYSSGAKIGEDRRAV